MKTPGRYGWRSRPHRWPLIAVAERLAAARGWQADAALRRRHLFRRVRYRAAAASHARRPDRSAGAGHSLQGVAARRRSRGDAAVDARFPHAGARPTRDQRPLLPAVSVRGQDRVGHRPRRIRRTRLLRIRNHPSRATRSSPTRRRSTSIATIMRRSSITIRRSRTDSTCGRSVALWNVVAGSSQIVTDGAVTRARVSRRQPLRRRARSGRAEQLLERQGRGPMRRRRERRSACRRIGAR